MLGHSSFISSSCCFLLFLLPPLKYINKKNVQPVVCRGGGHGSFLFLFFCLCFFFPMCHVGAWLFCLCVKINNNFYWSHHHFELRARERYSMHASIRQDSSIIIIPLLSLVDIYILHSQQHWLVPPTPNCSMLSVTTFCGSIIDLVCS